jgi:hypothetical protein
MAANGDTVVAVAYLGPSAIGVYLARSSDAGVTFDKIVLVDPTDGATWP